MPNKAKHSKSVLIIDILECSYHKNQFHERTNVLHSLSLNNHLRSTHQFTRRRVEIFPVSCASYKCFRPIVVEFRVCPVWYFRVNALSRPPSPRIDDFATFSTTQRKQTNGQREKYITRDTFAPVCLVFPLFRGVFIYPITAGGGRRRGLRGDATRGTHRNVKLSMPHRIDFPRGLGALARRSHVLTNDTRLS